MAATDQGRICCGLGSCTQMKLCHMCRQIQEGVAHAAYFLRSMDPPPSLVHEVQVFRDATLER